MGDIAAVDAHRMTRVSAAAVISPCHRGDWGLIRDTFGDQVRYREWGKTEQSIGR